MHAGPYTNSSLIIVYAAQECLKQLLTCIVRNLHLIGLRRTLRLLVGQMDPKASNTYKQANAPWNPGTSGEAQVPGSLDKTPVLQVMSPSDAQSASLEPPTNEGLNPLQNVISPTFTDVDDSLLNLELNAEFGQTSNDNDPIPIMISTPVEGSASPPPIGDSEAINETISSLNSSLLHDLSMQSHIKREFEEAKPQQYEPPEDQDVSLLSQHSTLSQALARIIESSEREAYGSQDLLGSYGPVIDSNAGSSGEVTVSLNRVQRAVGRIAATMPPEGPYGKAEPSGQPTNMDHAEKHTSTESGYMNAQNLDPRAFSTSDRESARFRPSDQVQSCQSDRVPPTKEYSPVGKKLKRDDEAANDKDMQERLGVYEATCLSEAQAEIRMHNLQEASVIASQEDRLRLKAAQCETEEAECVQLKMALLKSLHDAEHETSKEEVEYKALAELQAQRAAFNHEAVLMNRTWQLERSRRYSNSFKVKWMMLFVKRI